MIHTYMTHTLHTYMADTYIHMSHMCGASDFMIQRERENNLYYTLGEKNEPP